MSAADLSSIEGLDLQAGLKVVRGNEALYRKLLLRFRDQLSQFPSEFDQAKAEGPELAARMAHSLKGVAANLGALRLQQRAASLEQACKSDAPVDAALQQLLDELNPLLSDLARIQET